MATILIVDDRPLCREFLVTLLGYANHRLLEAADGMDALKLIESEKPDLVITDLLMPTMNGYELVQHIKTNLSSSKIPIIFYTASYLLEEAKLLAETCGVKYVLYKPSDPQVILDVVNEALSDISPNLTVNVTLLKSTTDSLPKTDEIMKVGERLSMYIAEMESVKKTMDGIIHNNYEQPMELKKLTKFSELFNYDLMQMDKLSHRLVALSDLILHALAERDLKSLLNLFSKQAAMIMSCRRCVIGIFNMDSSELKNISTAGMNEAEIHNINKMNRDHVLIKKILEQDGVMHLIDVSDKVHMLGGKLTTATHVYGFMYFADKIDGTSFDEDDIKMGGAIALDLAQLYENAELYDALSRHAAKLQLTINELANE